MTFDEFYPSYLEAHADPRTRAIHTAGTLAAVSILGAAVARREPRLLPIAVLAGYLPAWLSHLTIEGNVPKTFAHPLLSLRGDLHMAFDGLTGRLPDVRPAANDR